MSLTKPLNWTRFFSHVRTTATTIGLKSIEQLRESLERERMRADRSGTNLALVEFCFGDDQSTHENQRRLAARLHTRLRATDDAGILGDQRVGVLMPDTPACGAQTFARQICDSFAAEQVSLRYNILLYPQTSQATESAPVADESSGSCNDSGCDEQDGGDGCRGKLPHSQRTNPAPRSAEELFVQPLPLWKRSLDVAGALIGLMLAAPVLLLAAVAIKISSPGPVFFAQKRAGLGGRPFTILKLRTMCTDAERLKASLRVNSEQDGPAFKMKHDPRVTLIGRYLRKTCVDELPQLWNVLLGDMSLVGPRPLPCDESDKCVGWQRRRLNVTPGLTCIWQVSGGMRIPFLEWMRMDIRYINDRRPMHDFSLLGRTVVAVVAHRASQ